MGAEEEDVAGGGLDGEVLVDRSDRHALGVEDDPVVAGLGDGASTGEGGEPRPPARPEATVDGVVVEVGTPSAPSGLDAPGGQLDHLVERLAVQVGEGCGTAHQVEESVDVPLPGGGDLGHDLLGEDVQRSDRGMEHVEVAGADRGQERGAFHELVAGHRVEAPGRCPLHVVVGPPHPLQEGGDRPRGADLADELDRSDVDAELEGGGGDEGPKVARPEPLLDDASTRRRQAAVVGRHLEGGVDLATRSGNGTFLGAEPERELVGDPLRHLAGVDEDERGAVLEHVCGDPVQDVAELPAAGHRLELTGRQLDGDVEVAARVRNR